MYKSALQTVSHKTFKQKCNSTERCCSGVSVGVADKSSYFNPDFQHSKTAVPKTAVACPDKIDFPKNKNM